MVQDTVLSELIIKLCDKKKLKIEKLKNSIIQRSVWTESKAQLFVIYYSYDDGYVETNVLSGVT